MTKISQTEKNIRSADDADSADNKSARSPSPSVLPLLRYLRDLRINILPLKSARLERCPWPFEPSETIPGGMVLPHP